MNGEESSDREFVHTRFVAAPPEDVFRAFARPEQLTRWWGPEGFSSSFECFDLRPGGSWRFVLHGPDGTNYPNENLFRVVEAPRRVVIEHLSEDHHFFLFLDFEARDGGTRVGWRQVFDSAEHGREVASVVAPANEQNLDRLCAEVLRSREAGGA